MSTKKTVAAAIASGVALTGSQGTVDAVVLPGDDDVISIAQTLEVDLLILDGAENELALPPLPDAADEIGFDQRYAQTWGGGTGNDGLLSAPTGPDRNLTPGSPRIDGVSKPAVGGGKTPVAAKKPALRKRDAPAGKTLQRQKRKKKN